MEKYKCEDCGHVFEGDLSTMQCPVCGSSNIKKATSGPGKKAWIIVAAVLGAIILITLLFNIGSGNDKISASMRVNGEVIVIDVDGVSATALNKEYKVVVYDEQNRPHGTTGFMNKKKFAQYSMVNMMEGQCYTFNLERKDGNSIKNLHWQTSHEYCMPVPPVKPEIDHIEPGIADHTALVWNIVTVVMKQDEDFTYSIGNNTQKSPVFNGIKPGSYTVTVKNTDGVKSTQPLVLKDIKKLDPPLTLQQVQDIFDKVASGKMSASTAQDKLAEGNVNLSQTIQPGDIRTLWGALMEAAMGEKFNVNSFDNDPNTNKIKSGSLSLSKR